MAMSPPPSPVVRTIVDSGRAATAPGTLGNPSPIDWYAVPTIITRSGDATGQYMFDQPRKCPPSDTTTRSSGSSSPTRTATVRGSRRPSAATPSPASRTRSAATSTLSRQPDDRARRASRRATIAAAASAASARTKPPTCGCVAEAAVSTWNTRVRGSNSSPKRIVNWFRPAPNTTATSASRTSRIAPSAPKPPVTPRS